MPLSATPPRRGMLDRCRGFLYRRLAGVVTCQMNLLGEHPFSLDGKHQVNSVQDVFMHPFYWQLYGWLPAPPSLIVDLGAHCGHFSMLADLCLRAQFGRCDAEYHLVEPNPALVPVIRRNLLSSGLCPRHRIHQGLVGRPEGTATLWVQPRNFLAASLHTQGSGAAVEARYIDLRTLAGDRFIDVLKIDIEGAEYELLANYADLLPRVGRILIEIHGQSSGPSRDLCAELVSGGFRKRGVEAEHGGFHLAMFERPAPGGARA